jgi:hypothetical protein
VGFPEVEVNPISVKNVSQYEYAYPSMGMGHEENCFIQD